MLYIDLFDLDDYDKVIRFLLERNVTITERRKSEALIVAEVPENLVSELRGLSLKEGISMGTSRL